MTRGVATSLLLNVIARLDDEGRYDSKAYSKTGTWTPNLLFGGLQVGMTITPNAVSQYFALNTLIFCRGRVTLSAKGSSTGSATIAGLPFTSSALIGSGIGGTASMANMASLTYPIIGRVSGASKIYSLQYQGAASMVGISDVNFTDTSTLDFWVLYDALASECTWIPADA